MISFLHRIASVRSAVIVALLHAAAAGSFAQSAGSSGAAPQAVNPAILPRSFADWKAACGKLPANRSLHGRLPPRELLPLARFREFDELLGSFFAQCKNGLMAQTNRWVGRTPTGSGFFNTAAAYFADTGATASSPPIPFEPFAQKRVVTEGSEVFFHADFHSDIRSLLTDLTWLNEQGYLRDFSVVRTNFQMVFLGDYTDRGAYGVEVLYTLMRLKLANPDNVLLLRGNHEEYSLQTRYGFLEEGRAKYGRDFDARKVVRAYDFLPVVLYLGSGGNFIQCNHGGMEPGFSPGRLLDDAGPVTFQFLGALNQRQYFTAHPNWFTWADASSSELAAGALRDFQPADPISPFPIGFMWNDFSVLAVEPQFDVVPGRGFAYGARATEFLLRSASTASSHVQAVFRGHQHSSVSNPMMRRLLASRGVFRHWQTGDSPGLLKAGVSELSKFLEQNTERAIPVGSVWTFNVAPDSVYGEGCGYSFDSFAILKLARNFADWRLQVVNIPVEP